MSLDFRIFYDVSKFDGFFIVYCDYNNVLMIIVSLFGKGGRKDFVVCFIYFVILQFVLVNIVMYVGLVLNVKFYLFYFGFLLINFLSCIVDISLYEMVLLNFVMVLSDGLSYDIMCYELMLFLFRFLDVIVG